MISFMRYFFRLVATALWTCLLTSGCFLMFFRYCVYIFERFLFHRWNFYGATFRFIRRVESVILSLPSFGRRGYSTDTYLCGGGHKGMWQYNPRLFQPPNCTLGRHAWAQRKFLYWRHHNNSAFGSWYKPSSTSTSSATEPNPSEPLAPPWWYFPWFFFSSLCTLIVSCCGTHLHFKWWCCLHHQLSELLVSFHVIYHRAGYLLTKQSIASAFGFDDEFYTIYCTDFWRCAPIFGKDSSWVLAATAKTRSINCQKPTHSSTVFFIPSSFNIHSLQQIWPCVRCSTKSRSEEKGNSSKLKEHLNKWSEKLSMFTMIMDSGTNLSLFNN